MRIAALKVIEYESAQGPWKRHWLTEPSLGGIESAVLNLDGVLYPGVGLYLSPHSHPDDPPDFHILGGVGGYLIRVEAPTGVSYYFDPLAASEPVPIWQSDQGFECPGRNVCRDVQLVLAATRHYFHTGELLPTVSWQSDEEFGTR
jgi:hypothetical protein